MADKWVGGNYWFKIRKYKWAWNMLYWSSELLLPVGACMAELGMVAASWGTVLVSGSGVLVVGEVGGGFSKLRGFLC